MYTDQANRQKEFLFLVTAAILNLETILKGDHPGTMQAKFG
jgi:hypothetical protein